MSSAGGGGAAWVRFCRFVVLYRISGLGQPYKFLARLVRFLGSFLHFLIRANPHHCDGEVGGPAVHGLVDLRVEPARRRRRLGSFLSFLAFLLASEFRLSWVRSCTF
jgi:hypothetical protein